MLFDSYLHVIDPRHPLVPDDGYRPAAVTAEDHRARGRHLDDADSARFVRRLLDAHPHGVVLGTDLPSTRVLRPCEDGDLRTVTERLGPAEAATVLVGTARRLYRLEGEAP